MARKKEKGTGGAAFFITMLIFIGIAGATLHFTGKLQPLIAKLRGEAPIVQPADDVAGVPDSDLDGDVGVSSMDSDTSVDAAVVDAAVSSDVVPDAGLPITADTVEAAYRAQFEEPTVGSKMGLQLKGGAQMLGVLEAISPQGVTLRTQAATVSLPRSRMVPLSRARCYEDDYVKFMLAVDQRRDAERSAYEARVEKLRAEYERQRGNMTGNEGKYAAIDRNTHSRGGISSGSATAPGSSPRNSTSSRSAVSSRNSSSKKGSKYMPDDFKAWMAQTGQTEALKARQARIKEYEQQRIAAGREY